MVYPTRRKPWVQQWLTSWGEYQRSTLLRENHGYSYGWHHEVSTRDLPYSEKTMGTAMVDIMRWVPGTYPTQRKPWVQLWLTSCGEYQGPTLLRENHGYSYGWHHVVSTRGLPYSEKTMGTAMADIMWWVPGVYPTQRKPWAQLWLTSCGEYRGQRNSCIDLIWMSWNNRG